METVIGTDVDYAAALLRKGELVAIPTETVYGLGGNALDEEAVIKIYEAKQRPRFNPLIIHLPSFDLIGPYVAAIPQNAERLARKFSPGPISFLLPKTPGIPDLVTAGSDHVVVRIPAHPLTHELLCRLNFPLAAPSANPFGYISPVTAEDVREGLGGKIPYILDGGACRVGLESTIVGFRDDEVIIYRPGGVSAEEIQGVTGRPPLFAQAHQKPETPGQLKSHYAPETPLLFGDLDKLVRKYAGKNIAVISFHTRYEGIAHQFVLSPSGNMHEAARHLFRALRDLDKLKPDLILAQKFPVAGIGMAINDRLERAGKLMVDE